MKGQQAGPISCVCAGTNDDRARGTIPRPEQGETFMNRARSGRVAALLVVLAATFLLLGKTAAAAQAEPAISGSVQAPVPGMVTMVDLGATECIPCKMMAPIIEELQTEYQGRAAVVFIDVWKNPAAGRQFGIRAIPTQIFFDAQGKEQGRHEGFLDKQSIVKTFTDLGVK
jgi:thioredoxin 1